jgi:hypothetical protein
MLEEEVVNPVGQPPFFTTERIERMEIYPVLCSVSSAFSVVEFL